MEIHKACFECGFLALLPVFPLVRPAWGWLRARLRRG